MSEHETPEVDTADLDLAGKEAPPVAILPEAGPIVMDDEKFEEEQEEREQAYSNEPEWKGKLLQPFSYSRKSLFYSQRLSMGAPHLLDVMGDSMAFLADAMRILYLCSHDPIQYRHLRSKPGLMQDAIDAWADEQIHDDDEALEAVGISLQLYNASEANRPESVPSGGPGRDEELGN